MLPGGPGTEKSSRFTPKFQPCRSPGHFVEEHAVENSPKSPVDRRSFLKGAAVGAAAFVANPALPAEPQAADADTFADPPQASADSEAACVPLPISWSMFSSRLGIDYAMAMCAGNFAGITESVVHYGGNKNPEWITCMNEESSVEMAIGYAKIEGKPPLVCAHATVGLQHAAMGIYDAWCDRVPVYMMLGNTQDTNQREDSVTWVHSANDPCALVRDMIKWDDNPISMAGWSDAAVRAYRIAMTPPYGPVAVVIDENRHVEPMPAGMRVPSFSMPAPPQGDVSAVKEAARLMVAAQNPVIIAARSARTPAGLALLDRAGGSVAVWSDRSKAANEFSHAPSARGRPGKSGRRRARAGSRLHHR